MRKTPFAIVLALFVSCATPKTMSPSEDRRPQALPGATMPARRSFAVMGPLLVGRPDQVRAIESTGEWGRFAEQLAFYKGIGVEAVSTDVWWGLVEPRDNQFRWDYYRKIADHIAAAGLKWVPILSFHQCGGNVGDTCDVPLPEWIWRKYASLAPDGVQFKSKQGNLSRESISVWGSQRALVEYRDFMTRFQLAFADRASLIAEINVSLGPAGELRYPSYNSHDVGTGYPTQGAFQAYSGLALRDYREFLRRRYGTTSRVEREYGLSGLRGWDDVMPPSGAGEVFGSAKSSENPRRRDFLEWYADSLRRHGERILRTAFEIFGAERSTLREIPIGAKIPGIHWRMGTRRGAGAEFSDRGAEITAGLISADLRDWGEAKGYGYRPLLEMFSRLARSPKSPPFVLHFTCLEMKDGEGDPRAQSLANSLVRWVGREAVRQGLTIKGENALSGTLGGREAWRTMEEALREGGYSGLTVLRMDELFGNRTGREEFEALISRN